MSSRPTTAAALHDPASGLPQGMGKEEVFQAVESLGRGNRIGTALLLRALTRLCTQTQAWATQVHFVTRMGLTARHLAGRVQDILDIPGDLALLRMHGDSLALLRRTEARWQIVGVDGSTLGDLPEGVLGVLTEGVVLRMPRFDMELGSADSLSALWPALKAAWLELGVASTFISIGQLIIPLFAMLVYDKVVSNGIYETLWGLVIGVVIYIAIDIGMRLVRVQMIEQISADLTRRSDEALWGRLLGQVDFGRGIARFISNYRDLAYSRDFVSSTYLLAIADIPFLALYLIAIGLIAWPLLIVSLILVAAYCAMGLTLQKRANDFAKESEKANTQKLAYMGEIINCLDIARTAPGTGAFLRRWRNLSDNSVEADTQRRLCATQLNTLSSEMMAISTVVMLAVGTYLINDRMLTVGGLIACNLILARAMGQVASLFTVIGKWKDFRRASERVEESLALPEPKQLIPLPAARGRINVVRLTKKYEGRPAALDNVSFAINPGERVALLGRPGAGKTTLLRCLAGQSRADSGTLTLDGIPLEQIGQLDKARWLAWKPQDPSLFAGTLEDNLRVAGSPIGSPRYLHALMVSGLEDELNSGRLTLGMEIAERGDNLSGGQKQKVALARAFAQPASLILLDEPTLGLDPESERALAERLKRFLKPEDTLILTTHSAILLSLVDRIIALDGGRIIADGPREKLIQTHP